MKCDEPNPNSTYQDCQRDLGHSGQHDYLGTRWSRPEPAEPDLDVDVLLSRIVREAGVWGVEERSFPIVVTETVTRIIWVDAETEDQALAHWADDYSEVSLDGTEVLDADLEFTRPDKYQRQTAFRANRFESKIGPLVPCPDCGKQAFRRAWFHDPYRKCHGPIVWRKPPNARRAYREHEATPLPATRTAVTA